MKIDLKKKYKTRTGREVKLFKVFLENPQYNKVLGAILNEDGVYISWSWSLDGRSNPLSDSIDDLVEVKPPIMIDHWVNVYDDGTVGYLYNCREEADNCSWKSRVACINIKREVKEGDGLND